MPGIHRERPGADSIAAATDAPASDLGDGLWLSEGLSNTYMIQTSDGRIIVNAGMGFEGPLHRRAFDAVDPSPTRALIVTQGHYDHVGGIGAVRDADSDIIAQANYDVWRQDNARLEGFRSRNSAFAWISAIVSAMEYAKSVGVEDVPMAAPDASMTVDERLELTIGDRRLELIATPGGETFDSLVVWLPDSKTLLSGNLFGPLFGHVPNLVTIRGDRYRDALTYIKSLDIVKELRPERLLTGHFQPIEGADRIVEEVSAMQEAMWAVHDQTVAGMNAGVDVYTLMREVKIPDHLDVGEGYGKTAWNVRAIWENYAGWFHHRSTTELYGTHPWATAPDIVSAAGAGTLLVAARDHLTAGRPVEALQLTDLVLFVESTNAEARAIALGAHEALLEGTSNFWERAWLQRNIAKLSRNR
jgi:glyoxylase-like metal-dependent hydrolase (beta-lactamase superfamily II)